MIEFKYPIIFRKIKKISKMNVNIWNKKFMTRRITQGISYKVLKIQNYLSKVYTININLLALDEIY